MQQNALDDIEKILLEDERVVSHLEAQKEQLEQCIKMQKKTVSRRDGGGACVVVYQPKLVCDEVHEAVKIAMTEMNEYNPSGRYVVSELWNNEQKRKAKLKEAVTYIINPRKQVKTNAKRRRT